MRTIYLIGLFLMLSLGFAACSSDDDGGDGQLQLSVDPSTLTAGSGQQARFTVKDGGTDVTADCRIEEKTKGRTVENALFASDQEGVYRFVATRGGQTSNEVTVTVVGGATGSAFVKNMAMVVSTSVKCTYCPDMMAIIHNDILPAYPGRVQMMALHTTDMGTDPMAIREYDDAWRNRFAISEYPTAVLDYYQLWGRKSGLSVIANVLSVPAILGVAIGTEISGSELSLNVRVRATENPSDRCKLVVVLTEDGIVHLQSGAGENRAEKEIEHEWVVRKYLTSIFGDYIEEDAIHTGAEYTKKMTYTLDKAWNPAKMHAIVCIVDARSGKVMNCQGVELGKSVGYQYVD